MVAAGLSAGALTGVAVATQGAASAAGFGTDAFMNIDGNIRYTPNPTPTPLNQFGWANSGPAPSLTCSAGQVDVGGVNGLYNCGSPNPTVTNGVPVPPKYIGPSSVLAQEFLTTPDGNVVPGCGTAAGTYDFPGSQVFNEGLSQMSYGFVTNVPQKDAISDAYVVSRINSSHQVEVFFGAQRTASNGDSHVDFQFLQDAVSVSGTCSGTFSGSREQGDMLVEVNYQIGGSSAVPNVYMWVCNTASPKGTKCDTTGDWVQQTVPSTPVLAAIESSNSAPIPCGGWVCQNMVSTTTGPAVDTNEFVEGAINLGQFGFGVGCGSTVLVETRTSGQSGTSQLASLAKPSGFATCAPTVTTTTPSAKTIQLGQSLTDSVSVTGNASLGTPTGQVTFYVCSNTSNGCTSTANPITATTDSPNPVPLDSSGQATSPSYTPPSVGNYCFAGVYTPTPGNFYSPSSDTSADECFTVTPLTPTFTTQRTSGTITFGDSNTDTAFVAGNSIGGTPTGSVQFYLCSVPSGQTTCSGGTAVGSPVTLQSDPAAAFTAKAGSPSVAPAPGTYCFNASYIPPPTGGSYSAQSAESPTGSNECFTVDKQGTQTATHVVSAQVTFGAGGIQDNVSVAPVSNSGPPPTGTVQFYVCETTSTFCTPSVPAEDGTAVNLNPPLSGSTSTAASPIFNPTSAGTWCFSAVYSGDTNYLGSEDNTTSQNTDTNECVTVGKALTATNTTVVDAATSNGWTGSELTGASAYDTASVAPDPNFANAPVPTGTISYLFFTNGSCTAGTGTAAGTDLPLGSRSTQEGPLPAGHYGFEATYSGDGNYSGSTGACEPFTVNPGTSQTGTTVFDAKTNAAWNGTETTGASAYDTSSVTASPPAFAPTGTISYTYFTNGGCSGSGSPAGTLLALGTHSSTEGPLAAGSYSFQATYSGDSNYAGSTGPCESFTVGQGTSTTATVVFDAGSNSPWSGTETTGASAYDTSSVTPSFGAIAPTGTISYSFFTTGDCSEHSSSAGGGSIGTISATEGPLGAGTYSFQATYSGDNNYTGSTGPCEQFTVSKGTSNVATTVFDAATNAAWSGTETTGASAYDTSSVTFSTTNVAATGTVSYSFFNTINCSGNATAAGTVGLGSNSSTEGPLAAGNYSFQATYSGDGNFNGKTGSCEPLTVNQGTSRTATAVFDAATNAAWSGTELPGSSAYDTSTVTASSPAIAPSGTISYTFFSNPTCSTPGSAAGTDLALGTHSSTEGPLAEGGYSFEATYSGDTNYAGSTGPCETFGVGIGSSTTTTTVIDPVTSSAWVSDTTGASAYDTANVTFVPSGPTAPKPTGTISYTFFGNGTCAGTGTSAGSGLALGTQSSTEGPLAAGSYSFQASYSGDNNYVASVGGCEPFTVDRGTSSVATTVFDAATNAAWAGTETTGASAYDTSVVTASSSAFAPTGTVTYTFFNNGSCTADTGSSAGVDLALGSNSSTEGPLGAGTYSFQATYSGDRNYAGTTGGCEPFTVAKGTSSTATVVFDAASGTPWTGSEVGAPSAYDTSTVTSSFDGIAPTGTVSYTFFPNGTCASDTGTAAGTGLPLGSNSTTEGPLSQGIYSFQAIYSGDGNFLGSTGPCETFALEYPVITAVKSSSPVDGSVVHPGDTVIYTITLSNAGLLSATGVDLTDAVPAGTTYVANTASDGGVLNGTTLSWSGLTVPAGGTKAVTFDVTVNATDTDGQVIPNHAIFPNINTPQSSCIQSSDTTPPVTATSVHTAAVQSTTPLCDTNTVTLTVAIPIINVVKSEPTPGDGQTVTAGQSAPISYKLAVTNAGSAAATNVVVTDVIPTGATYVSGSATPSADASFNSSTHTITWTIPTVPAKSGSTPGEVDLTFQVSVNGTDANGSTITNQASFSNLNTPNCTAGPTTAVCLTNTVSNPVVVLQTAVAPQVTTTTTVAHQVLAFTGLNAKTLAILAFVLVGGGTILVLIGRRRRPSQN
jgi:uncharacterized repeat protein (TIGR01451 family)